MMRELSSWKHEPRSQLLLHFSRGKSPPVGQCSMTVPSPAGGAPRPALRRHEHSTIPYSCQPLGVSSGTKRNWEPTQLDGIASICRELTLSHETTSSSQKWPLSKRLLCCPNQITTYIPKVCFINLNRRTKIKSQNKPTHEQREACSERGLVSSLLSPQQNLPFDGSLHGEEKSSLLPLQR